MEITELFPFSTVKTVVQVGNGCQSPSPGDTVIFEKTFLTSDDQVIISSLGLEEYRLPMEKNRMPEALFTALSEMTINEISSFSINSNNTPNFGQENSSEVVGQLTRGGRCLLHLLDIQTGKKKQAQGGKVKAQMEDRGKGKAQMEDRGKGKAQMEDLQNEKPGRQPKLLADAMKASTQPKQAQGGKGQAKQPKEEKEKQTGKLGKQPKEDAPEKQPKNGKEKAQGGKGKAEKEKQTGKPGKQPKADAAEEQPKTGKERVQGGNGKAKQSKQAQGGKGKPVFENLEKGEDKKPAFEDLEKAEEKKLAFEDLEKAPDAEKKHEDLEKAQRRSLFSLGPSAPRSRSIWTWFDTWVNMSGWIGRFISIMVLYNRLSGMFERIWLSFKRTIRNKLFIKGIQFVVFGGIILGEKVKFVDKEKYPIKYRVLLFSGIFSLVFGFGLSFLFPIVGANFLDFISYVEIWIGGLGYVA